MILVTGPVFSQTKWTVPNLSELTSRDQIEKNRTPLSAGELAFLRRATAHTVDQCVQDAGLEDPHTPAGHFEALRVRRVPLNSSGEQGLIVQGSGVCMCGAVGNCYFWLIAERPSGFEVVLQTYAVQTFAIENTTSNGHFDVILGSHDSATRTDLSLYDYTGKYYRRAACALLSYQDDNFQPLKVPMIEPQPCQPR